jgi:hypothetical protein
MDAAMTNAGTQSATDWTVGPDQRTTMAEPQKPSPLAKAAFHGVAGRFVEIVDPHTEADRAAILLQVLVAAGVYLGRHAYYQVEADKHYSNLFTVLIGPTAKGRKGTSWGHVRRVLRLLDDGVERNCVVSGLSTGEGLIWQVRDPIVEQQASKEHGRIVSYQQVQKDPGVADKRLVVVESEFARVLKVITREGNTLSACVREAWDTGMLRILTKSSPARATNAHIGIVGHITRDELRRLLTTTEAANGFANRFLWAYVERSKELPMGGSLKESDIAPIVKNISQAAVRIEERRIPFSHAGVRAWKEVYGSLSRGYPGLLGAVIGRAEAQVVRLALIYALLDGSQDIDVAHLKAALAVWDYCEASARYTFGEALGDETADSILRYLRTLGTAGATRTDIYNFFARNKPSAEIGRALEALRCAGYARVETQQTDGRPSEVWFAATYTH